MKFHESGWEDIQKLGTTLRLEFNLGNVIQYFVTRTVLDGEDVKSINKLAENLYICGHIQNIVAHHEISPFLYIKARCLPEMRKDRNYRILMAIVIVTGEIQHGCPAGAGPMGSCKHIAALCYALIDFVRFHALPEFQTPTDKLQKWNQPRQKRLRSYQFKN